MSGDVQPRKRKDKKRKKDEGEIPTAPSAHLFVKEPSEDVNIHVHIDEGTGGGICAKIVFFILFSALIVLIGLIITEHRGLTDLDVVPDVESKYSQLFKGWVDDEKHDGHHNSDEHDLEELEDDHTLDDHDDVHMDDEENEENSDEHTLDDHDDVHMDDEETEEKSDEHTLDDHDNSHFDDDEDDQSKTASEEADQTTENGSDETQTKEEEYGNEYQDDEGYSEAADDDDDKSVDTQESEDDNADETEEINFESDDTLENSEMDTANDEQDDEVDEEDQSKLRDDSTPDDDDTEDENVSKSQQQPDEDEDDKSKVDDDDNDSAERQQKDDDDTEDDKDEITESSEKIEPKSTEEEDAVGDDIKLGEDLEKTQTETETEPEGKHKIDEVEQAEESTADEANGGENAGNLSMMIIKAIIGAAIMAVGHFVLVRKWTSDSPSDDNTAKEDAPQDLSRRNTLVPPPPLEQLEQDAEYDDEEYSDEEEIETQEDSRAGDIIKEKYEQLRSTYSKYASQESDDKNDNESDEDDEELDDEELEEEEAEEEEETELDEEDDEDYDDDVDEELMKKLEAKYGRLKSDAKEESPDEESDSEKLSEDNNDYEFSSITNKDDWLIREELDKAQGNIPNNAANALKMFEKILGKYPSSPRGFYGLAQALDTLAEKRKSNELLEEAISKYLQVIEFKDVPDALFRATLDRCIDRIRFRGKFGKAVAVHLKLIGRFPEEPAYRNQLAITYLTIGRIEQARAVLKETLEKWPNNGCALVHYGFIWKTANNNNKDIFNLEKGVYYMQKGIDTKDPCVVDGRFYFHLGDAYSRLGQNDKALKIYEEGVKHKLFLSKYQRSLYNVARLSAKPWWDIKEIPRYQQLFKDLETDWKIIREEGMAVLNEQGFFLDEAESLKDTGNWKQFELFARGRKNARNCLKTPVTCEILEKHRDASGCRRGQSKFSVMHPGTHVWAHCGPTNCRLRVHLGLRVPQKTFIRVADETRVWKEGKLIVFDDSFEHEVWHNGTELRLVLIVDVWHPELSNVEKRTLSSL